MKIELDMDEMAGLLVLGKTNNFWQAVETLHPEFMDALYKRVMFLNDIVKAGRMHEDTRDYFRDDELDAVTYAAMRGIKGETK
jgi:hypothetical protein